jgi:hypothetical protein
MCNSSHLKAQISYKKGSYGVLQARGRRCNLELHFSMGPSDSEDGKV